MEYELAVESDIPYLELYKRTLETGRVNTHDQELLDQINRKWDYLAEYQAYAKRVKKRSWHIDQLMVAFLPDSHLIWFNYKK